MVEKVFAAKHILVKIISSIIAPRAAVAASRFPLPIRHVLIFAVFPFFRPEHARGISNPIERR